MSYVSRALAEELYRIMNANIDIPAADLAVVLFRYQEQDYIGLLKMNYKSSYTHFTVSDLGENTNNIIMQKAIAAAKRSAAFQRLRLSILETDGYRAAGKKI